MKPSFSGVAWTAASDEVALVLAVVVVGDHDDLAALEGGDGLRNPVGFARHFMLSQSVLDLSADLAAMPEIVVGEHDGEHRLADRYRADADARVVAALGGDVDLLARRGRPCGAG